MGLAATASEPLTLVCGNIFYMAPEMIAETGWVWHSVNYSLHFVLFILMALCFVPHSYGTKLDVWAAGVVCCTLLSGIMPFGRYNHSRHHRMKYLLLHNVL